MHKGPANAHSFYFVKTHRYPATKMVITVLPCIMQKIHKQCQKTILCISSHSFSEDLAVAEVAPKSTRPANKRLLKVNTMVTHSVCDHSSSKSEHANSLCLWTRLLHFALCSISSILAIMSWQWLAAGGAYGITGHISTAPGEQVRNDTTVTIGWERINTEGNIWHFRTSFLLVDMR